MSDSDDFQSSPSDVEDESITSVPTTIERITEKIRQAPTTKPKQQAKQAKKVTGGRKAPKDATILSHLNAKQLQHLVNRIQKNWESVKCADITCKRSTLPLDGKRGGYPKSLRLTKKMIETSKDNTTIRDKGVTFNWNAAGVMLVHSKRQPTFATDEASHLCNHHPWCVNPEHVIWEAPKMNYKRKNCITYHQCSDCDKVENPCKHQPQCLDLHECQCGDWHKEN